MVSTTGSSASGQRPPHPEGNQPGEARSAGELAAEPKKNGKRNRGRKRAKADQAQIPAQPDRNAADPGGLEEAAPTSSAAEDQKLILPSTMPAERGPKAAVTLADFLNEPPREGVKASDQTKLIEARTTALERLAAAARSTMGAARSTVGFVLLFATASLLAVATFVVVVHVLLPDLSLRELAMGTIAVYLLGPLSFAGAIRMVRGGKGKGGA